MAFGVWNRCASNASWSAETNRTMVSTAFAGPLGQHLAETRPVYQADFELFQDSSLKCFEGKEIPLSSSNYSW